jgi:hypothetical protein
MKRLKTIAVIGLSILMMSALTVPALAADDFGSSAVTDSGTYTTEQMLTYAIEDEYMAYAEYSAILDAYGAAQPFTSILKAEAAHIAALEKLFAAYGCALPENTAADRVTLPADLETALAAGVRAEQSNIAMYDVFLSRTLPDDVRIVFEALKTASEHHLAAFERGLARPGDGTNAGAGNGYGAYGRNGGASAGTGYGPGTGVCTGTGVCDGTGAGYAGGGRGASARGAGTGVCILG